MKIYLDDGSFNHDFDTTISAAKLKQIKLILGEIILDFNYLESVLDDVLTSFIHSRSSDLGYTVIAKLTFSQKVDLFRDFFVPMCKHVGKPELSSLYASLHLRLKEAAVIRNKAIHARWLEMGNDFVVLTKIGVDKDGVYGDFIKLDLKTLRSYLNEINKTSEELLNEDIFRKLSE
ncbi:MAG: hypothetical protein HGA38_03675 [Candidatus Moranbacteria bacterium]|nr:hypothetical protein [Candidatus Moranbacteria bacterium]NTW45805.1 hypothetical protein [Candidatus Moranbacteria bacterium]